MKKFITFLIATFFVSMAFANVFCPQTIECSSARNCKVPDGWYLSYTSPQDWNQGTYRLYNVSVSEYKGMHSIGLSPLSCMYITHNNVPQDDQLMGGINAI